MALLSSAPLALILPSLASLLTSTATLDAVIVTTGKDSRTFEKSIWSALQYLIDVNTFYIISPGATDLEERIHKRYSINDDWSLKYKAKVKFIDEKIFNFKYENVTSIMIESVRNKGVYPLQAGQSTFEKTVYGKYGWFLQQLLKLYAGRVLKLNDYILLDSDLIWFRNISLYAGKVKIELSSSLSASGPVEVNSYYYATSRQYHAAYLATLQRVAGVPLLKANSSFRSGVVHHIVLVKEVLEDLIITSEALHGLPFWQVLLNQSAIEMTCRAPKTPICGAGSTLSEYELYFNFARVKYPQTVVLRPLWWANGPAPGLLFWPGADKLESDGHRHVYISARGADSNKYFDKQIAADVLQGYDFIGYHSYAKRRYTEVVWEDLDLLCKSVAAPRNSTCSWRGIEELNRALDKRGLRHRGAGEYFSDCNCWMATHQA